ncbi:hypothetical protein EV363DRAFT_1300045 [Boletus edulis]|nr:hypothetical protein EV363DRAFT_1300045 [Boletus edulis]
MSHFASWVDQYRAMANVGIIQRAKSSQQQLSGYKLWRNANLKTGRSCKGRWGHGRKNSGAQWEAITLFIDTDLDDNMAAVIVQVEQVQAEWMEQQKALPATQEAAAPGTSLASEVEVEESTKDLHPEPEKVAVSMVVRRTIGLVRRQSNKSEDEDDGMSTQCKRAITAELMKPSTCCQGVQQLQEGTSILNGQVEHPPEEVNGDSGAQGDEGGVEGRPVWVTAKASPSKWTKLPIILDTNDNIEEDKMPVKAKGKGKAPAKKPTGQTLVQKQRDVLAHWLNLLHSWMYQIWANLKVLEVKQDKMLAGTRVLLVLPQLPSILWRLIPGKMHCHMNSLASAAVLLEMDGDSLDSESESI